MIENRRIENTLEELKQFKKELIRIEETLLLKRYQKPSIIREVVRLTTERPNEVAPSIIVYVSVSELPKNAGVVA